MDRLGGRGVHLVTFDPGCPGPPGHQAQSAPLVTRRGGFVSRLRSFHTSNEQTIHERRPSLVAAAAALGKGLPRASAR